MINGSCTGNLTKIGKEIEESGVNVLISPVEITRELPVYFKSKRD